MNTEITLGIEARMGVKRGIDKACAAVAPTLGAVGMSALIATRGLMPVKSDDGITILKHLSFKNPYEQIGLELVRDAALRTSQKGGDGTATTTVLTKAVVDSVFDELRPGNTQELLERLAHGLEDSLAKLATYTRPVGSNVEQIAQISSLDPEVAQLISQVIGEVGINGAITVEKGAKLGYTSEVVKGARFNKGSVSQFFFNNEQKTETILEYPFIVLIDRKVSTNEQILSMLNSIGTGNNILFIADDVDSVALGTLAHNAMQGIANIGVVRNPYTGQRGKDFLYDIAAVTGATVISEERGMKLHEATKELCGKADKVIITRDTTTIVGGDEHKKTELNARIGVIEREIEQTTSMFDKSVLEERLASLTGGIGVIRVGTYTDTDFNAKKLKFDNAINATQAALQEGIVVGGGTALARVGDFLYDPIFKKALRMPLIQQGINADMKKKHWWLSSWKNGGDEFIQKTPDEVGFNFKTRKLENLFESGVVDPFKVTRLALESAVAIASTLVTGEVVIVNEQQ